MFNNKKDRQLVELVIEFNLTAIGKWLDDNGEIEDIEKIEKNWKDSMIQRYFIDMMPNGQNSDMYFHRGRGVISSNIGGVDCFENAPVSMQNFCRRNKILSLQWGSWRQYISLRVNNKPILLAPLTDLAELYVDGELKKGGYPKDDEQKIKVPISFESAESKQPKAFIEIWRGSPSSQSVGYSSALGSVSASTLNFEVEY